MSEAARTRLCSRFDVDPAIVTTIPHGAVVPAPRTHGTVGGRPLVLTWGLIGPGKGIERVVDAMRELHTLRDRPRYLVAGRTHPKVLAADGEAYRNARIEQAWRTGVAASVAFDASYRDVASLTELIQSAAVVVLPYDTHDQVTSGVLVDAIAAGRPVVATAFPHAVELLGSGAGIVVPHDDPDAMTAALRRVLTDRSLAADMAAEASRLAPSMAWPVVGATYLALGERLLGDRVLAACTA
jgi:polysaccharide biosynthesis protein PslF